jgi:DNA-binding SARP family transcriptional activator
LGPVTAGTGGTRLPIAAPSQQALLAQLLLHANRTVSASALIDGIYGDAAPRHPEAALQIIVSRLRRALGHIANKLVYDGSGYRIELAGYELDLTRARAHFARGINASRRGEMALAADAFNDALECWTGDPLAELTKFSFHDAHARCLCEFQFEVLERRNDAYLACGRHAEVLRDIDPWIAREPWREGLRGQQMTALYRAGRQIDALAVYDEIRELLLNCFGVDPNSEIQKLYGSILRQEVEVEVEELRSFRDCHNVFIVDGGPNARWLVAELTDGDAQKNIRRVALADFVAVMTDRLTAELEANLLL